MNRTNNNKNKEKLADSDHHRKTTTTNILVVRVEVTVVLEVLTVYEYCISSSSKMDRTQRIQQRIDDDSDSSSSLSYCSPSSQPIDDPDGYISDKDYADHDKEVIINESS